MRYLFTQALLVPAISKAGVHCTENITQAILHKNSNIYVKSSLTCPHWCQIKWTGEGDKDRAYSTLLAARAASKPIQFYWEHISSCSETNVTYESPAYLGF
jgi:hypothetical protein